MKILVFIFSNILPLFSNVFSQQYLDDNCSTLSNENGKCTYFEHCPSARTNLMRGIPPKICGYQGAKSIICCTDTANNVSVQQPVTSVNTEDRTNVRLKMVFNSTNTRLCQQKCNEYAKFVYKRTPSLTFLPGEEDEVTNTCGALDVELIIGGIPAKDREFPHMALVGYTNGDQISWNCGGSLISELYILTAAHCLYHRQFGEAKHIRLGDLNHVDPKDDAFVQQRTIIELISHPEYAPPSQYYDIALLKLNQSVVLNEHIRPACLQIDKQIPNTKAIASGWGVTEFGGLGSDALMQVTLDMFSYAQCTKTYKAKPKLARGLDDAAHVCAGSKTVEKDSCQGDSGGPLQIRSKEEYCMYNIIGITSFGQACGYVNIPGVYTRVSNYLDWIEGIVWKKPQM